MSQRRPRLKPPTRGLSNQELLASALRSAVDNLNNRNRTPRRAIPASYECNNCPVCHLGVDAGDSVVTVFVSRQARKIHRSCATTDSLRRIGAF